MYVETEIMYYTLLMGSFEPTRRELRMNLKKWFEEISIEKQERGLVYKGDSELNSGEVQGMMKQMIETSNEIFRLRKMINDLTETINQGQLELQATHKNPIISRSIQTIHLKRAQPLVIEAEKADMVEAEPKETQSVNIEVELVNEIEADEEAVSNEAETAEVENEATKEVEKSWRTNWWKNQFKKIPQQTNLQFIQIKK
ncbi:hypothetical protein GQR36_09000 [Enterococcus termitis]